MISKEKLLALLEKMPEQINIDDLLDKILLLQSIEEGLLHSEQGQLTGHESFKSEIEKWFKSLR